MKSPRIKQRISIPNHVYNMYYTLTRNEKIKTSELERKKRKCLHDFPFKK